VARWQYKTLMYDIKRTTWFGWERVWVDTERREYGPRKTSAFPNYLINQAAQATKALEEALVVLDEEGWELISVQTNYDRWSPLVSFVILRKPAGSELTVPTGHEESDEAIQELPAQERTRS
jgi:hypothetical protein